MIRKIGKTALLGLALSFSLFSNAAIVTGSVPSNYDNPTFGGSGIPNDQITYVDFGEYLLGIAITQRYASAPVTNSGSSYFAEPGLSTNYDPLTQSGSTWNFSFIAALNPDSTFDNLSDAGLTSLALHYDMDPSAGTDFGIWDFSTILVSPSVPVIESSQNYLFNFLNIDSVDPASGVSITAPGNNGYDEFGEGNFEIKWVANGQDAVGVDVSVSVSAPNTIALMLLSCIALIGARRYAKAN